ncbi:hypothetical protein E2C01_008999 [Portunus trituberculatus]|uniref:Uncharacterized protein n=1 Tax=Portunus trituberculatus TaxID=210409 RepID=A0A5B7D3F3_PORTR|nr:hypothetical protein [Portunus trituberculatus]
MTRRRLLPSIGADRAEAPPGLAAALLHAASLSYSTMAAIKDLVGISCLEAQSGEQNGKADAREATEL